MYRVFGESPTIKIVEWMLANQEFDHAISEIASGTELNIATTKRNFEPLVAHGVVKVSRILRKDSLYVLDLQNRCTKAIIEFDKQIAKCCENEPEDTV